MKLISIWIIIKYLFQSSSLVHIKVYVILLFDRDLIN